MEDTEETWQRYRSEVGIPETMMGTASLISRLPKTLDGIATLNLQLLKLLIN